MEPNTIDWQPGDFVILASDAKKARMVLQVIGRTRGGLVRSKHIAVERGRVVYLNDVAELYDPARFGVGLNLHTRGHDA